MIAMDEPTGPASPIDSSHSAGHPPSVALLALRRGSAMSDAPAFQSLTEPDPDYCARCVVSLSHGLTMALGQVDQGVEPALVGRLSASYSTQPGR
jgi:hypothetical protein